jgi:exo-beta-1,3-glucanase (GH17 family)
MKKYGAWIHSHDGIPLEGQIQAAADCGIKSVRSYSIDYSRMLAPILNASGSSLFGGIHVDADDLVADWHSQVKLDQLEAYSQLEVALDAICVGNELRQFGDHPDKKKFTARISFALANVLHTYREWLGKKNLDIPLTYAMEGIVFDDSGVFFEHLWPLVDACDIVSINLYPMGKSAWHGPAQFEESRQLLTNTRIRNNRFVNYEANLRQVLDTMHDLKKPLILSETGFPSAIGCEKDENGLIVPISDNENYGNAMARFLQIIDKADVDYEGTLQAIYFYEWRDNLYHAKINNIENSPIHTAFGLCDRNGIPKFDIKKVLHRKEISV